jgi:hypothetical protein
MGAFLASIKLIFARIFPVASRPSRRGKTQPKADLLIAPTLSVGNAQAFARRSVMLRP